MSSKILLHFLIFTFFRELLTLVRSEGDYLLSLYPSEFILRNILCIIMKFVREEAEKLLNGGDEEPTAFDSLIVSNFRNSIKLICF